MNLFPPEIPLRKGQSHPRPGRSKHRMPRPKAADRFPHEGLLRKDFREGTAREYAGAGLTTTDDPKASSMRVFAWHPLKTTTVRGPSHSSRPPGPCTHHSRSLRDGLGPDAEKVAAIKTHPVNHRNQKIS